jgi:hypothetical protein
MDFRKALRDVFGGGVDISAANPLPVDTNPGNKTVATIITLANLAAATVSALVDCAAVDLSGGPDTLALTIKARYNVAATQGIRVHVRTSPTNSAAGTHTAVNHLTIMTDAVAHFIANELVGLTIVNVTDGSSGVVTANTETTVTVAALAGGTLNQWTTGDAYTIAGADYDATDWDTWTPAFAADAVLRQTEHYDTHPMYVKVLVENLDPAVAVTDIQVIATRGV